MNYITILYHATQGGKEKQEKHAQNQWQLVWAEATVARGRAQQGGGPRISVSISARKHQKLLHIAWGSVEVVYIS